MSLRPKKDTEKTVHVSYTESLRSLYRRVTRILHLTNSFLYAFVDKEYAGHDITLAISQMKTQEEWLDRFVKMEQKWTDDAKGWVEYMESKYPKCAKLDKWDEDPESWPELTDEEKEALNKCVIM